VSNNREYWQKRFELLQESLLNKSDVYYDDLERQYKIASSDIEKEISAWYMRFARNNSITYVEAKKILNANELKEFRWTIEEYIKYGEKNAVNQAWMKQLENASTKYHITRLESLMIQLQQKMEVFFGNQLDDVDTLIRNTYTEGYFHTAYELQKGFNVGFTLQAFNENELEKVISKPWTADGVNFSERIWGNYRPQLINELQTQLTQNIIRGKSPDAAIKTIAKKFNKTRAQAGNLVMTESAYFSSLSRNDCYKGLGIGDFEIVSTLDMKTSDICRGLDGEHFPLKDYQVGVTAPPFHNFCRTTTAPFFNDEFTLGEKRAARNSDGKTYYVDGNIKYPEWEKKFVI
jgi:SPP1 gp7 family putative phage head morphogenesis protein